MQSYVMVEPEKLICKQCDIPEPGEDELLISIQYVGICGSDVHLFKGTYSGPNTYPMMFGHEWSGVVEKIGKKVREFKPGDKVTGDCSKFCGHCDMCEKDKNLCRSIEKYGITTDGASAEYIIRPAMHVYRAPDDCDMELLALTEPISVARHLIRRIIKISDELTDKKILIYGAGAIGLSALLLLKHELKCKNIDVFDLSDARIDTARKLGARIPKPEELKWTGGDDYHAMYNDTPYDIIIETTGVAPVFANALRLLKPLGILGCVGMIKTAEIEQKLIVTKALTIIGSIGGTGEFPEVIDFVNNNKDKSKLLISHVFEMGQAEKAFQIAADATKSRKVIICLI